MFQIRLNGHFEVEDPDIFIDKLQEFCKENKIEVFGQFDFQMLPPYIDYQKIEDE